MAFLNWTPKMSVGLESIDEQHKKLIAQINAVVENILTPGNSEKSFDSIMDSLVLYTKEHFAFEEELFARLGYPDTPDHLAHHERLRSGLISHFDRFRNKQLDPGALLDFLKDWLVKHILETDMKYSVFMKEHGVA